MTAPEILIKAVDKALINGLNKPWIKIYVERIIDRYYEHQHTADLLRVSLTPEQRTETYITKNSYINGLILDLSFAKALWPDEKRIPIGLFKKEPPFADEVVQMLPYAYHLQRMVLEENRFKYLERFLT